MIAFDVYGTLIDTRATAGFLRGKFGERAEEATRLWREKQLEFSFRRGLMRRYKDFDACTAEALALVAARFAVELSVAETTELLDLYRTLPTFPDVPLACKALNEAPCLLVALTNGTRGSVRAVLAHAGILPHFASILTADDVKTFKPDPSVYAQLTRKVGAQTRTYFVSGNAWDVIGARSAGLTAVWLKRDRSATFDPWEYQPDHIIGALSELPSLISEP